MANYFVNLPAPKIPGNAILDLTSINSGLDDIRNQKNINQQRADMLDQRNYQRGRDAKQDQREDHQRTGMEAYAISRMQPGPLRDAAWQRVVAKHPNQASLGAEYLDPNKGPAMVAAEIGQYYDPMDRQLKQGQLSGANTSNALHAQQLAHSKAMSPYQVDLARVQAETAQRDFNAPKPAKIMEVNGKIVSVNPDGTSRVTYDGGQNFDKLPEFAAKSAGFTSRMVEAENNIRGVMANPRQFDPTSASTAIARSVPEGVGNYFVRSGDLQRYEQAAEQWIRAFLRKESGAAIGKDEFKRDFKVYFPQAGDTPEVVAQKERSRLDAMRSFQMETRGYFDQTSPQHAQRMKEWGQGGSLKATPTARYTATNPQTGQKIVSDDGVNWRPADGR